MIQIRAMTAADITSVYRIETLSFRTPWSKQSLFDELKNKVAHYLVITSNDVVIGYCGMWVLFDECHITNIAIDPAYRSMGYGKSLLYATMMVADHFGASSMTLEVRETNRIAQSLYQSMGFIKNGFRRRYYTDTGEGAILLWNLNIQKTINEHQNIKSNFELALDSFEKKEKKL